LARWHRSEPSIALVFGAAHAHGPLNAVSIWSRRWPAAPTGVETADMLVQEVLSRNMRDRRAVARYAGLTGSPDESGSRGEKRDWPNPAMLEFGAA